MGFQRFLLKNLGTGLLRRATRSTTGTFSTFSHGVPASRPILGSLSRYAPLYSSRYIPKDFGRRGFAAYASVLGTGKAAAAKAVCQALVAGGPRAEKMVGAWLFGCAAWVFSLVVIGGVTRLTRSGLSMTDWKFTGTLPPLTAEQWKAEFEKYQQSPEYKRWCHCQAACCCDVNLLVFKDWNQKNGIGRIIIQ